MWNVNLCILQKYIGTSLLYTMKGLEKENKIIDNQKNVMKLDENVFKCVIFLEFFT